MRKILRFAAFILFLLFNNSIYSQVWTYQTNPLGYGEDAMIGKIKFVSPTEGWISTKFGHLLHTTNAGAEWVEVNPYSLDTLQSSCDPAVSMSWPDASHGWIISTIGSSSDAKGALVYGTSDGGSSWSRKILSTTAGDNGFQIQFADANNGWVLIFNFVTGTPTFLRTTDGGANWNPFTGGGIFYFVDAMNGWSFNGAGPGGQDPPYRILKTTNGGNDWAEQFVDDTPGGYNGMIFTDLNHGWIAGTNGKLLKTTNGGFNWTFVAIPNLNLGYRLKTVFFLDENNGWVPSRLEGNGIIPVMWHTTNAGATWEMQNVAYRSSNDYNSIFSIWFTDAQTGYLTGDWGQIEKFTGTVDVKDETEAVNSFSLEQNYPNPFNPSTVIKYSVKESGHVSLKVFDMLGKEAAVLVNEQKPAGSYSTVLDMSSFANGVYMYKLQSGSFSEVKKMILLK